MNGKIPMEDDSDMFETFRLMDKLRKYPDLLTKKELTKIKELGISMNLDPNR